MYLSKKHIPRRTFLRGAGVTLALPLLDAMVPALTATARTAAAPVPRLAFFGVANGIHMPHFRPAGTATGFELSPVLRPLAAFADQMVIVEGLSNSSADTKDVG